MAAILREIRDLSRQARQNFVLLFRFSESKNARVDDDSAEAQKTAGKETVRTGVEKVSSPIEIVRCLSWEHWYVLLGTSFIITVDYFDHYGLVISVNKLATYFHTTKGHMSEAITYAMLTRAVGAVIFGLYGDFYGRKWPLVINCILLGGLQIASIYCKTLNTFLGVRALFGVALGGIWGCTGASVLERVPNKAKGFVSGFLASCSSIAFIAASGANWGFGSAPATWKHIFWVGAGLSFTAAFVRMLMPESRQYRLDGDNAFETVIDENGTAQRVRRKRSFAVFLRNLGLVIKQDWRIFIYSSIFIALGIFYGSAVTNTFTTFVVSGKGLSNTDASKAGMIMKTGGVIGCIMSGYISETLGRRRTIIVLAMLSIAVIPAMVLPTSMLGLAFGGWAMMITIHGQSGVFAVHLNELFEPNWKASLTGVSYSIGASLASPAAQMVNTFAEEHPVNVNGKMMPGYNKVLAVTVAVLATLKILWTAFGPEMRGRDIANFTPASMASASDVSDKSGFTSATIPMEESAHTQDISTPTLFEAKSPQFEQDDQMRFAMASR